MKALIPLILLLTPVLQATELEEVQAAFLTSLKTPESVGMSWEEDHPDSSPDWFRTPEPGLAKLPLVGRKGFRFTVVEIRAGEETLLALVDTGAGTSLLSMTAAIRIGAHPIGPRIQIRNIVGFGGGAQAVVTRIPELRFGDVPLRNVRTLVFPQVTTLAMLPPVDGRTIDMLIGYDLLQAFDWVEFHSADAYIRVGAGKPFDRKAPVQEPLRIERNRGPQVDVHVNGSDPFSATLDTGGTFGLRLPGALAKKLGVTRRDLITLPEERKSGTGSSSTVKGQKVTLSIGQVEMRNLPTHLNLGNEKAAEAIGALIGNPVLSRLHWVLDHQNKKILLFL